MGFEKHRAAWIGASRQLGLTFVRGEDPTGVTHRLDLEGTVEDFPVEVKVRRTDKAQWTDFYVRVEGLPPGFSIRRRLLTRWFPFLPRGGVRTGDQAFDDAVVVRAADPETAQAFLSVEQRGVILDALERKPRPSLRKDRIKVTHGSIVKEEAVLVGTVDRMVRLASALNLQPPTMSRHAEPIRSARIAATMWTVVGWVLVGAVAMLWIFGYGTLEPLLLIGISALPLILVAVAFTKAREG